MGYLCLAQTWLGGVGSLHLIECPVSSDQNAINHLANHSKLQKILSPDLHTVFTKCETAPNIRSTCSLTMWWPLGLHNTSLDAEFRVEKFSFCLQIKSISSGTWVNSFLKTRQMHQTEQKGIIHSWLAYRLK